MRAGTFESINSTQLATATDRLLANGSCSKRRGPHIAYTTEPFVAPTEFEEVTEFVRRPVVARRRGLASWLVAAVVALIRGGNVGVGSVREARLEPARG